MAIKVRILAKELGISSNDLIEALKKLYVEVDDEGSSVNDKIAALMRVKMGVPKPVKEKVKKEKKEPKSSPVKESAEKPKKGTAEKKETKKGVTPETAARAETSAPEKEKDKEDRSTMDALRDGSSGKQETKAVEAVEEAAAVKPPERKPPEVIVVKSAADKDKGETPGPEAAGFGAGKHGQTAPGHKTFGVSRKPLSRFKKFRGVSRNRPFARKRPRISRTGFRDQQKIAHEDIKPYEGTDLKKIQMQVPINIRALAVKVNKRPNDLIQFVMRKGVFININQDLDETIVRDLLKDLGYELELSRSIEQDLMAEHQAAEKGDTETRAAVVTFMGHVDHGKTSLLDYIRNTMVTMKEKGGITQHIGAYKVQTPKGAVTFLDTPGHEAFTAMRARGAVATDVVVLVVAADDGVMPQTKEAIDHARAADVPIVVAINKCDLPGANPEKVKIALQKEELASEDLGGKTVMVEVSAKTGQGVDELVEMLMLETELLELRANPGLRARGIVIEGKKSAGQGVTATVLVKNGTLRAENIVLSGIYYGKVKAMFNDRGERIEEASPSTPVEILGLQGVPEAGDEFFVVKDEKKARTLSLLKQRETRQSRMAGSQRITLEDFHSRVMKGDVKELKIILKADVQGSVEALEQSLESLSTEDVKVSFVHSMVGDVNESDVMLAMVSSAVIIGFNVKVDPKAESLGKREKIDVRVYDVIYESISDVKAAMEGLLEPIEREVLQGVAQVKEVFSSKGGKAAGCVITKGTVHRKDRVRIKRGKEVVYEGGIAALKRFKDDVKDVREGFECGISFSNFNEIRAGDVVEAYMIEKVARRLEK